MDKFSIEAVDLGQVFKIRIRHDNSKMGADWYLDQVEVVDVDTEEVYMFLCERWLSKKKEDKRIERTFFVKVWNPCQTWLVPVCCAGCLHVCVHGLSVNCVLPRATRAREAPTPTPRRSCRPSWVWTATLTRKRRRRRLP